MTFDWLDYLTLAQNLAGQTVIVSEQAKFREELSQVLIVYRVNSDRHLKLTHLPEHP